MGHSQDYGKPPIDQAFRISMIGKYILVGITRLDHTGAQLSREQLHGFVRAVSDAGITIELQGEREGQTWCMPPDPRAISTAKPGIYTLKATGERIENPDLLASWTITEPDPAERKRP